MVNQTKYRQNKDRAVKIKARAVKIKKILYNKGEKHMASFKITRGCMDNLAVSGYYIVDTEDSTKSEKLLRLDDIITLCKRGMISNAKLILDTYSGKDIVSVNDKIVYVSKAKKNIQLHIVCRIISNDKCVGYIVKDGNNKTYKINTNKAWILAKHNSLENIEAKTVNKQKALISINDSLSALPIMQDNE